MAHQRDNGGHHGPVVMAESQPLPCPRGEGAGAARQPPGSPAPSSHAARRSSGVRRIGRGRAQGVRRLGTTREEKPISRQKAVTSTATSMPSRAGAGWGWTQWPRRRKYGTGTGRPQPEPGDGHRAAARHQRGGKDQEPRGAGTHPSPRTPPARAASDASRMTSSISSPARSCSDKARAVRFAAAVDPGERAEGCEDREVQAAQQHQRQERNKHTYGAPEGRVVVLVAGSDAEHLSHHLHVGRAPSCWSGAF